MAEPVTRAINILYKLVMYLIGLLQCKVCSDIMKRALSIVLRIHFDRSCVEVVTQNSKPVSWIVFNM